jgi:predicted O-methyltransferase YrrM
MTSNELDKVVMNRVSRFDINPWMDHLELLGDGQKLEVRGEHPQASLYYQWLACLMQEVKPKQVVELGAAAGISTIMMATQMPKESKLYSVDIDPTAWKWMKYEYPQVVKILGDDLDLSIYPKDLKFEDTDVWFMDSLHTHEQLSKEVEKFSPLWKKGAIVVFDDIRMPELWPIWEKLPHDKCENTNPCHHSGFGFCII